MTQVCTLLRSLKKLDFDRLKKSPTDILYFCDESSQVTDAYAAVAGLAVARGSVCSIVSDLKKLNYEFGKSGEVKWANAKSYGGRVHRAYIDYLFKLLQERRAHFHIRFSSMSEYDHELSGERRKIDTVSKAFYQLLLHRAYRCYKDRSIYIYPDDGEYTERLPTQIGALNHQGCTKFGGLAFGAVQEIVPRSSKSEPMLQLLDVPLGALAAIRNDRHRKNGYSPIKRELAEYVLQRTGWITIHGNSTWGQWHLNRWNVKPKW